MQMRSIRGKNLVGAGYDAVTGTLRVAFGKSGEYDYSGVPEEKFISLCQVPYPDNYYSKAIKGKFTCVKVVDPPEEPNVQEVIPNVAQGPHRDEGVRLPDAPSSIVVRQSNGGGVVRHGLSVGRCDAQSTGGRLMEVFYGEKDGVTFTEEGHAYFLKGARVPFSLTQILELSGISRQPTSAKEMAARPAAAKRGTKVHEYTLWLDQGELDLDDLKPYPEYLNRVIGWQQFREDFKFMPDLTMCEVPIAVRVNGMLYAMKLDAYGAIGEGEQTALAVVEKKCTAEEEDSHAIQTAGQAIAFESHAASVQMPLKRLVVYLFDKLNAANRYYRVVEHSDRNDQKIFVGAALANVYWRSQKGLLK